MKKLIENMVAEGNGSTRFYQNEGWELNEIMEMCNFLDKDLYSYGLMSGNKGDFVEIIQFGE